MRRLSEPRKTANFPQSIHQQLNMYALAAGAAGVSVLALAQPSEAKIVYTHAHVVIGHNGVASYNLDLNHDGITDFSILWNSHRGRASSRAYLVVAATSSNAVVGSNGWADDLNRGAKIGSGQTFYAGPGLMLRAICFVHSHRCEFTGHWLGATNRYLGLKFTSKGKTHYAWARLSVKVEGIVINATLTGYAYETIPGKPIKAGQTKGAADDLANDPDLMDPDDPGLDASLTSPIPDVPQPASLGMLALGARGMPLWRRKQSVGATQ